MQSKNNSSQGPDKLNIRHINHIDPLGLAFIWKLAIIVPIPKPNNDIDKGTSYRPISLLSVIAKTLEKSFLPYITSNISNTPHPQHGYKTQHSIVTAHTVNNTVGKGFNQMAPNAQTVTVALDMSKPFDTIKCTHLSESCYRPTFQAQSLSSSQTTSKSTQHMEITHPRNVI